MAATIKMIQNVLIGVTAFGIAVYWCTSVEKTAGRETSLMEIWHRFPKFVIGFLTASIIFSIYSADLGPDLGTAPHQQGRHRRHRKGRPHVVLRARLYRHRPEHQLPANSPPTSRAAALILYVCGQSFNLALTLLMAYVMFYLVFPEITAKIQRTHRRIRLPGAPLPASLDPEVGSPGDSTSLFKLTGPGSSRHPS